eukprot:ANDGO_04406.mRNA.1 hypothetical protein
MPTPVAAAAAAAAMAMTAVLAVTILATSTVVQDQEIALEHPGSRVQKEMLRFASTSISALPRMRPMRHTMEEGPGRTEAVEAIDGIVSDVEE